MLTQTKIRLGLIQQNPVEDLYQNFFKVNSFDPIELKVFSTREELIKGFFDSPLDVYILNMPSETASLIAKEIRINEVEKHAGLLLINQNFTTAQECAQFCLENEIDDFLSTNLTWESLYSRIFSIHRFHVFATQLKRKNFQLENENNLDSLTHLENMSFFRKQLEIQVQKLTLNENKNYLGVVILDLDDFKKVNDSSHHQIGSFVLQEVANLIKDLKIKHNIEHTARLGGDEFVASCLSENGNAILEFSKNLHKLLDNTFFSKDGFKYKVSASFGICLVKSPFISNVDEVLKGADYMLYRSKFLGKNQIHQFLLDDSSLLFNNNRENFVEDNDSQSKLFQSIKKVG